MVFVTTIITPTACNGEIGAVTAPANAPIRAAWQGRSAIRASVRLLGPDQWRKCPQEALIASSFGGTADLHSIGIDSCRFELIT